METLLSKKTTHLHLLLPISFLLSFPELRLGPPHPTAILSVEPASSIPTGLREKARVPTIACQAPGSPAFPTPQPPTLASRPPSGAEGVAGSGFCPCSVLGLAGPDPREHVVLSPFSWLWFPWQPHPYLLEPSHI